MLVKAKGISICLLCVCSLLFAESAIGEDEFSPDEIRVVMKEQGALKAFHFLLGKSGHQHLDEKGTARRQAFLKKESAGDIEALKLVDELYANFDEGLLNDHWAQNYSSFVFKSSSNPQIIFNYWYAAKLGARCDADVDYRHVDGESAFDISSMLYLSNFIQRRESLDKVKGEKFKALKKECLKQIESLIHDEVSWMKSKGFKFNEDDKLMLQEGSVNGWIKFLNAEAPQNLIWLKSVKDTLFYLDKRYRESDHAYSKGNLFSEFAYGGSSYEEFSDEYFAEIKAAIPFQRRMAFYEKVASADKEWLIFVKQRYADFDKFVYFNYKIPLYIMLGDALTNDPQAVLSIFKEEFSKDNELKSVCGNTYEDLLWGVAVEEQVIGAALEKLEARKKALISMKDKGLSDMKNQCIQAVDKSLAVWNERAQ